MAVGRWRASKGVRRRAVAVAVAVATATAPLTAAAVTTAEYPGLR
ncbi:hypothetical protein O7543_22435 [Solwaraspora sp. WMMA2080]|nr:MULTISPECIES: hypothetical protein [unclassified Solwaraspora]WBB96515.1 hypothetical protein O7553_24930 [Solwaraspora sp. WMMA2059]WBC19580.1 hypothetical protein O7543_22435 [Solwaraspora sp. WMMA2080]